MCFLSLESVGQLLVGGEARSHTRSAGVVQTRGCSDRASQHGARRENVRILTQPAVKHRICLISIFSLILNYNTV